MLKKSDPLCPIKCRGHDHGAGCKGPGAAAESASGRGELEQAQAAARAASAPPAAPTALAFSFPSLSLTLSGRFLVWAHRGRRFVFRTNAQQRGPPPAAPSRSAPARSPTSCGLCTRAHICWLKRARPTAREPFPALPITLSLPWPFPSLR